MIDLKLTAVSGRLPERHRDPFDRAALARSVKASERNIYRLPERTVWMWAWKIHSVVTLLCDYLETLCDQARELRVEELKQVSRLFRMGRKLYFDDLRTMQTREGRKAVERGMASNPRAYADHTLRLFDRSAQQFEDDNAELFARLSNGLNHEVAKMDIMAEYRPLMVAAYQVMTLYDVLKMYGDYTDREMRKVGVIAPRHAALPHYFMRMGELVGLYAGDRRYRSETREASARAIYARLYELDILESVCLVEAKVKRGAGENDKQH